MGEIRFVSQTGTKNDDDGNERKAIRRHVMLGKNRGRAPAPKQPKLQGASVFRAERRQQQALTVVPRRVGSDLSFLEFADTVEETLMNDTLQFSRSSAQNTFVLAPCVDFDAPDSLAMCMGRFSCDPLWLNVMVYTIQTYLDLGFRQIVDTSGSRLQYLGKALQLLREKVVEAEQGAKVDDMTIMAVILMALHSLVMGQLDDAKNHAIGMSRLVRLKEGGINSFRGSMRQLVDIVRGDISVSLATGEAPLLFNDSSYEDFFPLPDLKGLEDLPERPATITHGELANIWDTLKLFCGMINGATDDDTKVPYELLIETMASAIYRLLDISVASDSSDEMMRFAMLTFCASIFLHWGPLRMPFKWLQSEYKQHLRDQMPRCLDTGLRMWLLMMYEIAFSPLPADESEEVRLWLQETKQTPATWDWTELKRSVECFLWVDIVCDHQAQKLFKGAPASGPAPNDVQRSSCP